MRVPLDLPHTIYIGWDAAEMMAWNVAHTSLRVHTPNVIVKRLALSHLHHLGLYRRPTEERHGQLYDVISEAPMSTGHAIARFFVPTLCGHQGWALFTDGDVLFRADVDELFKLADDQYAVMVVPHPPGQGGASYDTKKAGHVQQPYPRKNWSSVMLLNCEHPYWRRLSIEDLNQRPGRDLHAFYWLHESHIGALPAGWNYLVGVSAELPPDQVKLAHYTLGVPDIAGHEHDAFADEWFTVARAAGYDRSVRYAGTR
jgi:hypothetical protein